ncbi:ABC transporter [Microbacterium sp. 22179]|uniref:ABC transporter n=1 Tax=Microbacterium sp. 22179 TaxID=3453886 RepID=UPI003F84739A
MTARTGPARPSSRKDPVRSRSTSLALLGALALGLAACTGAPADLPAETATDTPSTGDGHGAIAGAEEVAEPPLGLTAIDPAGTVTHLDLLDETVTGIGAIDAPRAMTTDGRYLFADVGDGIEIVDSGVWTWDHVDHFHYYRASPALLGTVDGDGSATVATTNSSTSGGTGISFTDSGDAVLLSTEALSKGEIREQFRLEREPHAGLVVPVGSFALVTEAVDGVGARVAGYTADGEPTGLDETCAAPSGTITTRVGAVIGCADGALLAHVDDGELVVERIPYPADAPTGAVTSFDNREGRPTVAGLASPTDIRLLDTRARTWTLLTAPAPLVHVTAVDDEDGHLLGLAEDGRMLVLSAADGSLLAETAPLVAASLASGEAPVLVADQHRAYLSAPVERQLYEIDYADAARIARTFETATEPAFVAETGR